MQIEHENITIRELTDGYEDNDEAGVVGFGGKLNIRPPYQREFVYNEVQRNAVIDTVTRGFPLNTMYWAVIPDGFEVIDGQQRTISICQYIDGVFSYKDRYFHNLQDDEKENILNYKLTIYKCEGTDSQKLDWFRTINIAGEKLTDQELRNAVYAGSWTAHAKLHFSKTQCAAARIADKYMDGSPIRQHYLETVISWISGGKIEDYMGQHQDDTNANALWLYFQRVIGWVEATFPNYRREMKGLPWGELYNKYGEDDLDPVELETKIKALMIDDEVGRRKGIYEYLLSGNQKHLQIRTFSEGDRRAMFERQSGVCPTCKDTFELTEMEADHITPWSAGGKTDLLNGQMLCKECNRRKSNI